MERRASEHQKKRAETQRVIIRKQLSLPVRNSRRHGRVTAAAQKLHRSRI